MIKKTSFHRLNNNELNTLINRIVTAIGPIAVVNTGIVAVILKIVTDLNNQLTASLNKSLKTGHGKILKSLDDKRDDAFKAVRDALLGCSRRLNEVFRVNAIKLVEIFRRHGWSLWTDNYQEESAKLNSLVIELDKEDNRAGLSAVNLVEWFNELKMAQEDFEKAFQDKASDDIKKDFVAIKEIRPKLINNAYEMLDRIDLDAKYSEDTTVYNIAVSTLNNIIGETATLAKGRQTRNSNGGDE